MITLEIGKQFEELKNEQTVLEFTAGWCPDCKVIKPDLSRSEKKYSNFKFVSVDRNKLTDLVTENNIMGIPNFLIYKNGELMGSYIGKERKSIEQVDPFSSQYV